MTKKINISINFSISMIHVLIYGIFWTGIFQNLYQKGFGKILIGKNRKGCAVAVLVVRNINPEYDPIRPGIHSLI